MALTSNAGRQVASGSGGIEMWAERGEEGYEAKGPSW